MKKILTTILAVLLAGGVWAQEVKIPAGQILAPAANNCASVPYSFTGDANTGLCTDAADTVWIYANGEGIVRFLQGNVYIPLYPIVAPGGFQDTTSKATLYASFGSEGIMYQRGGPGQGAIPQQYHWAYFYTDASNLQGGMLKTSASGISIEAETAGSGADNLDVTLTPAGTGVVKAGSVRIKSTGAPSVAGSCGTDPSVAGQDTAMVITAGTVAPTSCAVTFQSTWTTAPVCTANAQTTTTALNVVTTATTVTVSAAALTASEKIYVLCVGY